MRKILAISALTLAMAGSALAQTTSSTTHDAGELERADRRRILRRPTAGTLRPEAEIRTNFAGLTAEQQAAIRLDCEQGAPGGGGEMELSEAAKQACNMIKN